MIRAVVLGCWFASALERVVMQGLIGCLLVSTATSSSIGGSCETIPIGARVVGRPAVVTSVERGGPAAVAELARGDTVVELEGQRIENRFEFEQLTSDLCAGVTISVDVVRNGRTITLLVAIQPPDSIIEAVDHPTSIAAAEMSAASRRRWYGWETLAMDGTAVLAGAIGAALLLRSEGDSVPGSISSSLGGLAWIATPVNHALRGRWKAFAWSSVLRVIIPALSIGILFAVLDGGCSSEPAQRVELGCAIGVAASGGAIAGSSVLAAIMVDGWTSWHSP